MHALARIVVALVHTVNEQIHQIAVRGDRSHVGGKSARQFVANEWVVWIVETGAQNELVETRNRGVREERIFEPARPVITAEIQTKRALAGRTDARALVIASLKTNAAVDLKAGLAVEPNELGRDRSLPRDAVLHWIEVVGDGVVYYVRVAAGVGRIHANDPRAANQIIGRCDDRNDRQRANHGILIEKVCVCRCQRWKRIRPKRRRPDH